MRWLRYLDIICTLFILTNFIGRAFIVIIIRNLLFIFYLSKVIKSTYRAILNHAIKFFVVHVVIRGGNIILPSSLLDIILAVNEKNMWVHLSISSFRTIRLITLHELLRKIRNSKMVKMNPIKLTVKFVGIPP